MKKFLISLFLLIPVVAYSATTPNSFVTPQTPKVGATRFVQGTDTPGIYKTIYTGQTNGSKCFALLLNHNDQSATHLVTMRISSNSVDYDISTYTTVTGSAPANTFGTPVNLFSPTIWPGLPVDSQGNAYIYLQNGDALQATFATALTATNQINIVAYCGDF